MINVHRLEGFWRVAAAGGYTRAAKAFPYPITQPGVHQQVRRLEEELGVRLLVRAGRDQVRPTPAGERLLAFCTPFFEQLPRIAAQLAGGESGGTLRIDAAALEIRHVMPTWIRAVHARHPQIQVELEEVPFADLTRLSSGKADLLVDYMEEIPRGFVGERVGTHHVFLVAPRAHAAAQKKRLRLVDFAGEPFIAFSPSQPQARRQLHAVETVATPRRVLTASTTEAILGFVAAGLGYSLVPWPTETGPRVEAVRAERMRGRGTTFPIWAVSRDRGAPDPLVQTMLAARPR